MGNKASPFVVLLFMMRSSLLHFFIFSCFLLLSCAKESQNSKSDTGPKVIAPVVTDARGDLLLSWFSDGGPKVASAVKEVPEDARKEVRVQDPTQPPEKRDPSVIFLADLTKPQKNGQYPVKTMKRSAYEAKRRAAAEAAKKAASSEAPTGSNVMPPNQARAAPSSVVMYATRHCPVCIKARRWLLEQKIPYVEKDVEKDPQAAQALHKKGAAQGVPTQGVPIFEIGGRLLAGFEPNKIIALLAGATKTQKSI